VEESQARYRDWFEPVQYYDDTLVLPKGWLDDPPHRVEVTQNPLDYLEETRRIPFVTIPAEPELEPDAEQRSKPSVPYSHRRPSLWHSHVRRFCTFGGIGALVFLVGTALQWVLLKPLGADNSYIAQSVFSIELSYVLNRWLTWRDRDVPVVSSLVKWNAQKFVLNVPNVIGYDLLMRAGMNWLVANLAATAAFTVVNYVAADKWTFIRRFQYPSVKRILQVRSLPLLAILGAQAGLSLRLIWSNTAFQDEALYLWAGRLELAHWLHGSPLPGGAIAFPAYFSGAPVIYPPLGALANDIGGLAGARLLSMCFMLGATALLYSVTCRLFDRRAAVVAAAAFALIGPTQNLGAFATYDAMALFLLALASWLAVRSGGRWGELALIACAVILVLADATKYASLLWDPVVIALAVLGPLSTRQKAFWRGVRLTAYGVAMAVPLLFVIGGRSYVAGLMFTTLSRQILGTTPPFEVIAAAYHWVGVAFILAFLGFTLSFSTGNKRIYWLCGILTAAALLAPLNQARIDTLTSLQKHVAFGAWFSAIAAGYAATAMMRVNQRKGWRIPALALSLILALGVFQASTMYSGWPNSSGMTRELSAALSQARCPCLIAEPNVASYYLPNQIATVRATAQLTGPYVFYYWDTSTQRELVNVPAYKQAIKVGYFGVIEMDDAEYPATFAAVTGALASSHDYKLLATIPASNQKQPFKIWIRERK
jgi:putative flippase GtrA